MPNTLLTSLLASDFRKRVAWGNASPMIGRDPNVWRQDDYGSIIRWGDYGDRKSAYGWEIDHRVPTALGGTDASSNLRALHWQNNATLGGLLGKTLLTGG